MGAWGYGARVLGCAVVLTAGCAAARGRGGAVTVDDLGGGYDGGESDLGTLDQGREDATGGAGQDGAAADALSDLSPADRMVDDQSGWDQAPFDQFRFDQAPFDQPFFDQARLDQSPYDQSPFDSSPFDQVPADGPLNCASPKINELMPSTSDSLAEEFIEVYNPCPAPVLLSGWSLVYRSASNTQPVAAVNDSWILYAWGNNTSIPAFGHLVYGGAKYTGPADGALLRDISDNGSIGLRNAAGTLVDSVAYGLVLANNAFIETQVAQDPPKVKSPGNTLSRLPDGKDTNNNFADFQISTMPTPKGQNQ